MIIRDVMHSLYFRRQEFATTSPAYLLFPFHWKHSQMHYLYRNILILTFIDYVDLWWAMVKVTKSCNLLTMHKACLFMGVI